MSQSQDNLRNWEKKVSPGRNVKNKCDSDGERSKWLDDYFAASHSDKDVKQNGKLSQKKKPANNSSDGDGYNDIMILIGLLSPKKTYEDHLQNHEQSCSSSNWLAESAADSNSASQKPSSIASSTPFNGSQVCSQKMFPKNPKPSIKVDPEVIYISSDDELSPILLLIGPFQGHPKNLYPTTQYL